MKRRWLFIPLVIGMLAIGITGGAVLAQDDGTDGDSPLQSFVSRVADILGLEEAQVQDAFDQAAEEMQDEALQRKLDHMMEQGRLTQEEADEYLEWYQSRPEGGLPGLPGFHGKRGHFGGPFGGGPGHRGMGFRGFWGQGLPAPTPDTLEPTAY